ncbi:hypothetical protein P154DRAFT_365707 [Amniculicola lignicola CBS 123094]|uniref:Uncharacterized protein n=1 Tax=Amniculicola lignicola CBS 123094 TaxID=1392246 RepID=A0A6A5VYM5_9PLEO|nr:hypothetical protein P154DRAFT_365707 [Amniculicola lignicola CBS 123094]
MSLATWSLTTNIVITFFQMISLCCHLHCTPQRLFLLPDECVPFKISLQLMLTQLCYFIFSIHRLIPPKPLPSLSLSSRWMTFFHIWYCPLVREQPWDNMNPNKCPSTEFTWKVTRPTSYVAAVTLDASSPARGDALAWSSRTERALDRAFHVGFCASLHSATRFFQSRRRSFV